MNLASLQHVAETSGGILYLMVLLLFIALVVIIEKFWSLSRMIGEGADWIRELKKRSSLDDDHLRGMVEKNKLSLFARVSAVALEHDIQDTLEHFSSCLDEAVMEQLPEAEKRLWVLDTSVTLAPLLGLLGTIIGMFNTFQALAHPDNSTQQVTGGVGEALVSTAAGLFIAILGLVAFNALSQRVQRIMHKLELVKLILTNRMYSHYRKDSGDRAAVRTGVRAAAQ